MANRIHFSMLSTARGSLTNAAEIHTNAAEIQLPDCILLFSYHTLVGVKKDGKTYFQRDGAAGSRTTGRHLSLAGYRHGTEVADEAALEEIAFPTKQKARGRRGLPQV